MAMVQSSATFSVQSLLWRHAHLILEKNSSRYYHTYIFKQALLRSTLGERFVIFGDPVVDGIPVHARREDSRFLVTWTGDVQNLRHFE